MSKPKAYSYLRFSTPEQESGDSVRRQIANAENWAKNQGIDLDDILKFEDRGISAYRGLNRIKGALGNFLNLVKEGKIPYNSYLIVENLDRLSRENVIYALLQFLSIIQQGIRIVTLMERYGITVRKQSKIILISC